MREQDDNCAILAHELRAPLNVLHLSIGAMLARIDGPGGEVPARWMIETLRRQRESVRRLQHLIDSLLESWRLENGPLELRPQAVDLSALVREVLENETDALDWAGCPHSFEAPAAVHGHWDPLRLRIAVTNLLNNAIKYGAGRPIEVSVGDDRVWAWVSIVDHGSGIAAEDRTRIFERFVRAKTGPAMGGSGLGLWLVRSIAHAHGGEVSLSSAPGEGASFRLALPCRPNVE
jgi:signal transduction histidine kinase